MNKSVYHALIQYEEVGGDLIERIKAIGVYEVFEPIIEEYESDLSVFNRVLFYTLYCYSRESDYHINHVDWDAIKTLVAKKVDIDIKSELFGDLFHLKNVKFTICIRKYMDYQGSKSLKHLLMLKDLYEQMVNSAIENIQDKDGIVMYDQKIKNAEHADKLYEKIAQWEQRVETEEVKLNKSRTQLKEVEKKRDKFTLRMEDNLHDH